MVERAFGALVLAVSLGVAACGGGAEATTGAGGSTGAGGGSSGAGGDGTCALTADTTETSTVTASGCHVLDRDTSACKSEREAAGLSGFWLALSCRVKLSAATENGAAVVEAESDGLPDHASNYFAKSDACHDDYTDAIQNPNEIAAGNYTLAFPLAPSTTSTPMKGAIVGLAVNGVPIFGNFAAPGDDIFKEAETFDRCGGHPQMSGVYHYHSEPYAISYDDDRLVGVLRDGYPLYGRKDADGTYPTLDEFGGHTGTTPDSPSTPVYHYHVNEQTSMMPQTAGKKQWFLTTGTYRGAPAATCDGCN
jgi:hypothetical protein